MNVSLFEIFKIFFIIGLQLLGGGYVILPLLKKYLAEERQWLQEEELIDYFAMSQCIPGVIAVNIAIFSGYKVRKTLGAISAIIGLILPAFICIIILANILIKFINNQYLQNAFWGIRISVIILIIMTIKEMWVKSINSMFTYVLFFSIVVLLFILSVSPAIIIILSAIAGIIYSKMRAEKDA